MYVYIYITGYMVTRTTPTRFHLQRCWPGGESTSNPLTTLSSGDDPDAKPRRRRRRFPAGARSSKRCKNNNAEVIDVSDGSDAGADRIETSPVTHPEVPEPIVQLVGQRAESDAFFAGDFAADRDTVTGRGQKIFSQLI